METNIGIKGLGIHLDPADSYKTQISVMTKKSNEWSHVMKNSVISCLSATLALRTTIIKSHQYKIPALTLSKSECEKIMKPVYNIIISKIGVNKHIPLEYRYGPKSMQGLELLHLYTIQGIEQIRYILQHGGQDNQIG